MLLFRRKSGLIALLPTIDVGNLDFPQPVKANVIDEYRVIISVTDFVVMQASE